MSTQHPTTEGTGHLLPSQYLHMLALFAQDHDIAPDPAKTAKQLRKLENHARKAAYGDTSKALFVSPGTLASARLTMGRLRAVGSDNRKLADAIARMAQQLTDKCRNQDPQHASHAEWPVLVAIQCKAEEMSS